MWKKGKGEGKGHHCCLCAQNSVVWWHPHDFIYTLFSCEICVPEHGPYQFQENSVAGQIRIFIVLHLVCLVLMVAMVPHPCPFPSPFPFFHQVQAAEQLACTCGKRGRGRGRGTIVSVCTKLCSRVAPKLLSTTLFSCEFCVSEHGPYQFYWKWGG